MIPDDLIEKAESAAIERWGRTGSLRAALTATLEAVAADIWDEGFARGVNAYDIDASLHETREIDLNPYRASETA